MSVADRDHENARETGAASLPRHVGALRPIFVWIAASVAAVLIFWRIGADHFAVLRHVDAYVTATLNPLASQNAAINHAILGASEITVFTGTFLFALVWYCWFEDPGTAARERLLLGGVAVLITALLSRVLQLSLPLRMRPLHDLASGFHPLAGIDPAPLRAWGSFPSDHAMLFFALVAVIWQRSRRLGLLALAIALYGTLPRIYAGLHYITDVAAGALVGVAFVLLFEHFGPRGLARRCVARERLHPGLFYGIAFVVSVEAATLFEDIRKAGTGIMGALKLGSGIMS